MDIPSWLVILFSMLLLFIVGNYGIHLYCIRKHQLVLERLRNRNHIIFNNVRLNVYNKLSFNYHRCNLVIADDLIFIFNFNSSLNGLIKRANPVFLFYKGVNSRVIMEASVIDKVEKITLLHDSIIILPVKEKFQWSRSNFKLFLNEEDKIRVIELLNDYYQIDGCNG